MSNIRTWPILYKEYTLYLLVSLIFHVITISFILWTLSFKESVIHPSSEKTVISFKTIRKISNKMKNVGSRKGRDEFISFPIKKQMSTQISQKRVNLQHIGQISHLKSFKRIEQSRNNRKIIQKTPPKKITLGETIKDIKDSYPNLPSVISNSHINIKFEAPYGLNLDELNKIELKFYSFNKRVFSSYIDIILKSFFEFYRTHPTFNYELFKNEEIKTKVVFYKSGIVETIIPQIKSNNSYLQRIFDSALIDLYLPNPPEELLQDDGFSFIFQLSVTD